jgi:hypothetical protein
MPDDLDALVDELYGLPLERFVPERGVLAKALRAEGRRADAAQVAALLKPSIVAWAVNQVVRAQPEAAATLWAAGDAVVEAQERVVAGAGSGAELRGAVTVERQALAPLAEAARGLLTGAGRFLGEQNVQVVVETLHAAAVDPGVREDVERGRLTRPLQLAGVGAGASAAAAPPDEAVAAARRERTAQRDRDDDETEAERRRAERERRARRDALQRALVRAERDRDKARERIVAAASERDAAAERVERARQALEQAEAALATDHAALERAEEAVDAARAAVEDA